MVSPSSFKLERGYSHPCKTNKQHKSNNIKFVYVFWALPSFKCHKAGKETNALRGQLIQPWGPLGLLAGSNNRIVHSNVEQRLRGLLHDNHGLVDDDLRPVLNDETRRRSPR